MPEFRKICDAYQGYNFKKDRQTTVGFITKLTIGGTALVVDQTVKDPLKPSDDLKVVAVLTDALWELGVTDALYFTGQVSVYNRQTLMDLVINNLTNIEVVYQFTIYEYDPVAKVYFKCFHCKETDMKGLLEKKGEDLNLTVADQASTEVQSPENYTFNTGIKPQPSAQALTVCSSSAKNVVKAWGLTVAG
ncbi:hypothetical protein [Sorangium sp. So ce1099]|uniref:hypothetical protein n=1 Tax=Sorangium sp. So ce1099 TaxID=3133331 RepID=UPI003F5FD7AA